MPQGDLNESVRFTHFPKLFPRFLKECPAFFCESGDIVFNPKMRKGLFSYGFLHSLLNPKILLNPKKRKSLFY